MNQSEVNTFLQCLSRMSKVPGGGLEDDHDHDHDHDHHHHHHGHAHSHSSSLMNLSRATTVVEDSDTDAHNLIVAKATAMAVLFCATTLCGAIPFLLNRCFKWTENNTNARSATVVKCLLYFGGGVLLCTTFLHLLPEVQETVESLQECGTLPELTFALAELLMCLGFFAMFLIEEIIHAYIHNHRRTLEDKTTAAFERGHSIRQSYLMRNAEKDQKKNDSNEGFNGSAGNGSTVAKLSVQDLLVNDMENQKYQMHLKEPTPAEVAAASPKAPSHNQPSHNHSHSHSHSHEHHSHSHMPLDDGEDLIASSLRGLLIVLALSLHELFEGLAIGLEGSASTVWFMFAAVSAHKLVLAFCVGVELIVARTRTALSIVYVITFAIVSPIGIGIGILISNQDSNASSIPSAILQGLACGTLLYVVFFEILSKNRSGMVAYIALFVGFGVMFGLQQIAAGHEHSHGCSVDTSTATTTSASTEAAKSLTRDSLTEAQTRTLEQQLEILRGASSKLSEILKATNK